MNILAQSAQKLLQDAGVTVGSHDADIVVHNSAAYWRPMLFGSLGLGESYMDKQWDAEHLDVVLTKLLAHGARQRVQGVVELIDKLQRTVINTQSALRAFQVGEHHYDLGNELYEDMLGESMGYSSAYFRDGAKTLTEAQYAKFDRICQKLALAPGMRVLEIGAGFGTFAEYAARTYGVEVVGLTVSKEQKAYAEKRCEGLPVEFILVDYRKFTHTGRPFDRVVSIEMIEAVGPKNFRDYFTAAHAALHEHGLFLVQAIVSRGAAVPVPDPWISKYIFPNGVLPSLPQLQTAMHNLFTLGDYEAFGSDYDKTLMAWDERFRERWDAISLRDPDTFDKRFYRMWRYYLLACAAVFRSGEADVAHLLLRKGADPRFT